MESLYLTYLKWIWSLTTKFTEVLLNFRGLLKWAQECRWMVSVLSGFWDKVFLCSLGWPRTQQRCPCPSLLNAGVMGVSRCAQESPCSPRLAGHSCAPAVPCSWSLRHTPQPGWTREVISMFSSQSEWLWSATNVCFSIASGEDAWVLPGRPSASRGDELPVSLIQSLSVCAYSK